MHFYRQTDGLADSQREKKADKNTKEKRRATIFFFDLQIQRLGGRSGKKKKFMVFRPFEHNPDNKELTTGSSSGPGSREKGSQREVKKKCCILGSLSPAAWGHLRDSRLNYPAAPAARRIRRTRGEDERS